MSNLTDGTLSDCINSEFDFEMKVLPGGSDTVQENVEFTSRVGDISLSLVEHWVKTYYTELEYELSGLKVYTESFKVRAERFIRESFD